MGAAFSSAYDAGVFRGRLNEAMSAETYLALVLPFLPPQSTTRSRITLGPAPTRTRRARRPTRAEEGSRDAL